MKIESVERVEQWGYGEGSTKFPIYITSIRAETLAEKAFIYKRTPSRREGYQRELSQSRLGKGKLGITGYLLNQMGLFPTSVLVNVRKEEGAIKFDEKTIKNGRKIGDLTIPDECTWYIVDGQHRLEGLKTAMREKGELKDYPVMLSITNEDVFTEMLLFYLVNSRAKSVKTGLAYRILQRMLYDEDAPKWVEKTIMVGSDRRKAIAATIVDYLNMDIENPFKGKILEIGEPSESEHLTTDATLTRYVSLVLSEKMFEEMYDKDVAQLLADYWTAISEIYPDCFNNPTNYHLLGTIGLSSFMRLFPTIYGYCAREGAVTKENMRKYLEYLLENTPRHKDVDFRKPINEIWFHTVDGPGIVHGTGEGLYTEVGRAFAEKISLVIQSKRARS